MQLDRTPIWITLDRPRELRFNLNAELLVRAQADAENGLLQEVGTIHNPETGEDMPRMDVHLANLRVYLWAALQADARARGDMLSLDAVGELLDTREKITEALSLVGAALAQYYGGGVGETAPRRADADAPGRPSHGKTRSARSAAKGR